MSNLAYGINSLVIADINPADGSAQNPTEFINNVYRNTIEINEPEETETDHYVEGSRDPLLVVGQAGKTIVNAMLVNLAATQRLVLQGGAVATVDSKDQWTPDDDNVNIEKHVTAVTEDGHTIVFPRVKVKGRFTGNITESELLKIAAKMTVLKPQFAGLKSIMVTYPAP